MTEILTADYRSESTENLIKRAEQILSDPRIDPRIYPRADDIIPYSRSGFGFMDPTNIYLPIRTLAPACNRIEVKNVITIIDSSIVTCTGSGTGTCGAIPGTCPTVNPTTYVNMVATVNALVAQNGVTIRFEYLLDDVPTTTNVIANLVAGSNTVYCFAANVQYSSNTTLALFDARVV